jgi:hypothetical protein
VDIGTVIAPEIWTEEHVPPPFVNFDDAGSEHEHNGEEYRYLDHHHFPVSMLIQLFDPRKTMVNLILSASSKSKPNALSWHDRFARSGKSLETGRLGG